MYQVVISGFLTQELAELMQGVLQAESAGSGLTIEIRADPYIEAANAEHTEIRGYVNPEGTSIGNHTEFRRGIR